MREVIAQSITIGLKAARELSENSRSGFLSFQSLISDLLEGREALVAGADPVPVLVRCDGAECLCTADPLDRSEGPDLIELLLTRRVVLRLRVEDFGGTGVGGVLHQDGDGDACSRA